MTFEYKRNVVDSASQHELAVLKRRLLLTGHPSSVRVDAGGFPAGRSPFPP